MLRSKALDSTPGLAAMVKSGMESPLDRLIRSLEATPAPPCEGCPQREKCAAELLACHSFLSYVNADPQGGGPRLATRRIYNLVYRKIDRADVLVPPSERFGLCE